MLTGRIGRALGAAVVVIAAATFGIGGASAAQAQTYKVQLDARPPAGEPWAFLRIFPGRIQVHQGDTINATFLGTDTPHTGTFVPTANPNQWRRQNQGPGGRWAPIIPDVNIANDEQGLIINPAVANPTSPGCGTSSDPCTFNGSSVTSSGLVNPGPQTSLFTKVTAPTGTYSFVCLLHPGMQIKIDVVPNGTAVPSPKQVASRRSHQVAQAVTRFGPAADATAQRVTRSSLGQGHALWSLAAGGFFKNVSANEFPDAGLKVHVGDKIRVGGNFEIHTATAPASAAMIPFIVPGCEGPNGDTPPPCADPSELELTLNPKAITPTELHGLGFAQGFRNTGLLTDPSAGYTFVARKAGTYHFVCLVHGPEMSLTVKVSG